MRLRATRQGAEQVSRGGVSCRATPTTRPERKPEGEVNDPSLSRVSTSRGSNTWEGLGFGFAVSFWSVVRVFVQVAAFPLLRGSGERKNPRNEVTAAKQGLPSREHLHMLDPQGSFMMRRVLVS